LTFVDRIFLNNCLAPGSSGVTKAVTRVPSGLQLGGDGKCGYLMTMDNKKWKKRWFEIKNGILYEQESPV
jgi:hypothetical protein